MLLWMWRGNARGCLFSFHAIVFFVSSKIYYISPKNARVEIGALLFKATRKRI